MKFEIGDIVRLISVDEYINDPEINKNRTNQREIDILKALGDKIYIVEQYKYNGKVLLRSYHEYGKPLVQIGGDHMNIEDFAFPESFVELWYDGNKTNISLKEFENILGETL